MQLKFPPAAPRTSNLAPMIPSTSTSCCLSGKGGGGSGVGELDRVWGKKNKKKEKKKKKK